ncbi:MAG: SGNH/GDSL hydrolase family protein [Propionibacteriales bacterium]|nr:SGNH/GDSL hydrolase family protein [Propionibacteriales bacterium]
MGTVRRSLKAAGYAAALAGLLGGPLAGSTTASSAPTYSRYVALGDSFTAGPLIPSVDTAAGCVRSTNNYPAQVAERLAVETFVDVSCSNADTSNMATFQQTFLGHTPAQFEALTPETDLVSVGIGGNDFGLFAELTGFCPTLRDQDPAGAPCREHFDRASGNQLEQRVERTKRRLVHVVRGIRMRSPDARVLVVGYPQIAPAAGSCPQRLPLADGDYRYAVTLEQQLNAALRLAAHVNQVDWVDTYGPSEGHDICSDHPWVNGSRIDTRSAMRYHPFRAGMDAVADEIESALTR